MAYYKPYDRTQRAQKRIQGEDVFGQKIKVSAPSVRCYTGQKLKNVPRTSQPFNYDLLSSQHQSANVPPPPGFENTLSNAYPYNFLDRSQKFSSPMELGYEQCQNNFQNKQEFANLGSENAFLANLDLEYDREFNYKISPELGGVRLGTQPVSLHITNLDPTMEIKEIKKLLTNMIKQYAMILSINVFIQSDGLPTAHLKVSNQQEAQFVISQLHRQKIGHKRMLISYDQNESTPDPEQLKLMVISVLQDVPDKRMPLFKFMELLESRYLCTSSLSEINKLKDIVRIKDENGSRVISLTDNAMRVSSLGNLPLQPQCVIHSPQNVKNIGWCEMTTSSLPNVMIGLKTFTGKLLMLLNVHFGSMPLVSFQNCYEQVFHEPLPVYDYGVPLEHLISCVLNVEIKSVGPNKNIKMVKHEVKSMDTSGDDQVLKAVPPVLAPNVAMLCREVVDLLKNMEKCQISLTKFVPAYHHHFGRQCRVADYGFIKLLDLLEAISHVVQIMGEGHRRVITLTHATQIRRFTSDLLRVLKVQPNKQIAVQNFPEAYEKAFSKPFNPVEYGLCSLEDLLEEIPENTVVIIRDENEELYISVPKKEQTSEEIMKTKQFANEVVDLLRHTPYYTMLFNKFVPSYHHHFGYQCRVSDYGFTKLIELFEAIPDVVEIKQLPDGERTVSLTIEKSIQILNTQIMQVMRNIGGNLTLDELPKYYLREFGYSLSPQIYGCETMEELIRKLSDYVQVVHSTAGPLLHLKEMDTLPNTLRVRCWILLLSPPHVLDLITFRCIYSERYQRTFTLEALQAIVNVVSLSSMHNTDYISLTPLYVLAAQLYYVICNNQGAVEFSQLEKCYEEYYQKPMKLSSFGIKSANMFYNKFNLIFYIRGCKKKSVVVLNKYVQEHLVFNCNSQQDRENEWNVPEQTPIGTIKRYSPPKPDTPPSPNTTWMTPSKANKTQLSFTIDLPSPRIDQQLLNQIGDLISPYPTRHWLSVNGAPWDDTVANSTAPEASELPLPNKLLPKAESDDSGDSGVNVMLDHSPSELPDSSCSNNNSGAMKKKTFQGTFLSF
ncbi:hypothetical protein ABEB36_009016 [Hypothenemus hampei]|uniref:HTH OST-type domain-containing protein n=1 Tax=Hypothenemus hampei TaxID=57062 RepID=A0ABD1ENV2_HYPHA